MSVNDTEDRAHRFADVTEEPCIMFLPIEDFIGKPLVTLEQATEPLVNIIPHINKMVYMAKCRSTNPANDLTVDESAAIALYTMEWEPYTESVYYLLNQTLRAEDRQILKRWFLYLKLLFTALSRLPSISVTVYRRGNFDNESDLNKYQGGKEIVWWGFSSCHISRNVFEEQECFEQTGRRILFIIDCINGKNIEEHSYLREENEVLLLPCTHFKVVNNEHQRDGSRIVHLKEVDPSFMYMRPEPSEEETIRLKTKSNGNEELSVSETPVVESRKSFRTKISDFIAHLKPRSKASRSAKRTPISK